MEFDSPEEQEFPGLYEAAASEGKNKRSKDESDFSEEEHDKATKKKDKGKDRGYAALEGESSVDEDVDAKSPSKTKRSRAFIFTSSKSKEKREKSRDKEKSAEKDVLEPKFEPKAEPKLKEKDKDRYKEKEQCEKDKKKEKKEKEKLKKEKSKDKEKKDKKSKKHENPEDEELALKAPIFGVNLVLANERNRCHDGVELPIVLRDNVMFLQEHSLRDSRIYRIVPSDEDLEPYKHLYNCRRRANLEGGKATYKLDVSISNALVRAFLMQLPEPVLTEDLQHEFENVAAERSTPKQVEKFKKLLAQLPLANRTLVTWMIIHFACVTNEGRYNRFDAWSLPIITAKYLRMSEHLMTTLLLNCKDIFPDTKLTSYVPPLSPTSSDSPDNPEEIQVELAKQESLLAQLHYEMNAGFVSKRREEQLWEVQRFITQLKRKLKAYEKKSADKSRRGSEEPSTFASARSSVTRNEDHEMEARTLSGSMMSMDGELSEPCAGSNTKEGGLADSTQPTVPQASTETYCPPDEIKSFGFYVDTSTGLLMVPRTHPNWADLLRQQLEQFELLELKKSLQARISAERAEYLRLKKLYQQQISALGNSAPAILEASMPDDAAVMDADYDIIIEHYERENQLLEQKKDILAKEIFEGRRECIALTVELGIHELNN